MQEIFQHPRYSEVDRNQYDDIALLYLKTKITYNIWVQPACVSNGDVVSFVGQNCTVLGYGATENPGN